MSKLATKASNNVFYKARMNAAAYNDGLSSREGASEQTGIDRNRIAYTELGTVCPYPEEVVIYSDAYNAPELMNYYCSTLCPIGKQCVDGVRLGSLEQASLMLLSSTKCISEVSEQLIDVAKDGDISPDEIEKMEGILAALKVAANDIKRLELVYKKMMGQRHEENE